MVFGLVDSSWGTDSTTILPTRRIVKDSNRDMHGCSSESLLRLHCTSVDLYIWWPAIKFILQNLTTKTLFFVSWIKVFGPPGDAEHMFTFSVFCSCMYSSLTECASYIYNHAVFLFMYFWLRFLYLQSCSTDLIKMYGVI